MPNSDHLRDLNETEILVLRFIRTSPHRVTLGKMSKTLSYSKREVASIIRSLLDKRYIRQDRRGKVSWEHEQATFFTEPSRSEEIDHGLGIGTIVDSPSLRPLRVFLCHSSNDKPVVHGLYRRLGAENIDPWLDEEKLLPGQDWSQEIAKAVRTADAVVVCLSRGSISKAGYIQKEIKYALDVADGQPEGTIFLIPLKLEECEVPERLRRWQWVNYFDENGYKRLMKALRVRAQSMGEKEHLESPLSQVMRKYEGQRIKAKGNERKGQFFVHKVEVIPEELNYAKQEFEILCTEFFGKSLSRRRQAASKIAGVASRLSFEELCAYCRSSIPGERAGAAIGLGAKISASVPIVQSKAVISALEFLLSDAESRVRYRALETLGVNLEFASRFYDKIDAMAKKVAQGSDSDLHPTSPA